MRSVASGGTDDSSGFRPGASRLGAYTQEVVSPSEVLSRGAKAGAIELGQKRRATRVAVAAGSGKQNPTQETRWGPCPFPQAAQEEKL